MSTSRPIAASASIAVVIVALLAGCNVEPPSGPNGDQDELEPNFSPTDDPSAFFTCLLDDWTLDIARYEADSLNYLKDLNIPVGTYSMTGVGKLSFDGFGAVNTSVALSTKYTLVVNGATVFDGSTPSNYDGQGFWAEGQTPDTLDFEDWVSTTSSAPGPDDPALPAIDFTGVEGLATECRGDKLFLQGPDGQIPSFWTRL